MVIKLKKIDYFVMIIFSLMCFTISVIYLHICPHYYQSSMVVMASNTSNQGQGASSISSLLVRGGVTSSIDTYSQILVSTDTADMLSHDDYVMNYYFNKKRNSKTVEDSDQNKKSTLKDSVLYLFTGTKKANPDAVQELLAIIKKNTSIQKDNKTNMLTISYTDKNPYVAATVLGKLHLAADKCLRIMAQRDADLTTKALEDQLNKINSVELREVVVSTLTNQSVTRLISSSYASYMVTVLIPPTVQISPIRPKPGIILLLTLVISFVVTGGILLRWRNGMTLWGGEVLLSWIDKFGGRHN